MSQHKGVPITNKTVIAVPDHTLCEYSDNCSTGPPVSYVCEHKMYVYIIIYVSWAGSTTLPPS